MKKTKTQKGITLLALVITIVVLLILAGVAINSITSTNLIDQAATAGQKWNEAQGNESTTLGSYESEIDKLLGKSPIKFTIDGVEYTAKKGETWEDWVKNNPKFTIAPYEGVVVLTNSGDGFWYYKVLQYWVGYSNYWVTRSDKIMDGMNYEITDMGGNPVS